MRNSKDLGDIVANYRPEFNLYNPLWNNLMAFNFGPDPNLFNPLDNPFQDIFGSGGGWNPELGSGAEPLPSSGVPYNQPCEGNQGFARDFDLGNKPDTGYVADSFNVEGTNFYDRIRYDGGDHLNLETLFRTIGQKGMSDLPASGNLLNQHLRPGDLGWEGKIRDILKQLGE